MSHDEPVISPPLDGWLDAIERYRAGTCTPAEVEAVRAYLAAHPGADSLLAAVHTAVKPEGDVTFDSRTSLDRLHRAIDTQSRKPVERVAMQRVSQGARVPRLMWGAGAGVLIAAAAVFYLSRPSGQAPVLPGASGDATEYATTSGQRATIRFPDGGSVVLGPNSKLRYITKTGQRLRDVVLDGEAYFDVRHDPSHALTVHTRRATAQVLGTQFVVKAYGVDSVVQVAVSTGKVALRSINGRQSMVLTHGHVGRVTNAGSTSVEETADLDLYLGWTTGRLAFRGVSLGAITRDLERWCDVDIRFDDPAVASMVLAVSFRSLAVDDVLTTLTTAAGLRYTRTGRVVTLFRDPS